MLPYFLFFFNGCYRSDYVQAGLARTSKEEAEKNWKLLKDRLEPRISAVCHARHARLQDQATREDPEWQQQYAAFLESEIQNATFAMLQFFDPDSYLQQAEAFAED